MLRKGGIYRWRVGKPDERIIAIVSNDSRCKDKFINMLFLSHNCLGHDVVEVGLPQLGDSQWLHCGMLTYSLASEVGEQIGMLTPEQINEVNGHISNQLGIVNEDMEFQLKFYKSKYREILDKLVEGRVA